MIRKPQSNLSRQSTTRSDAAPTKTIAAPASQPVVLDDKRLKEVAGGHTSAQALPKGTW